MTKYMFQNTVGEYLDLYLHEKIYVSEHSGWVSGSLSTWRESLEMAKFNDQEDIPKQNNIEDYNMCKTSPNIKRHAAIDRFEKNRI